MRWISVVFAACVLAAVLSASLRVDAPDTAGISAPGDSEVVGWPARVQMSIAAKEYEATANAEGLQAPNRAHNLRTYFEPTGIRVQDRTAPGSPELLRLSFTGVGRDGAVLPLAAAHVFREGARVELRRPGLIEWYENSPAGLEQGFTLAERPAGEGPVVVELAVGGARAALADGQVLLATAPGRRLTYGKLEVLDAAGAPVAAHFEVPSEERVRILLADAGALYPVTIDPLLTGTPGSHITSNDPEAVLGTSVSGAGDVNGDGFDDVIVGAPGFDAGLGVDQGAAFVFLGSSGGILGDPPGCTTLDPGDAHAQIESDKAGAELGTSVSGAGDVNGDGFDDVIVGARFYENVLANEGAAFIFLGSSSGIRGDLPDPTKLDPGDADAQIESDQMSARLGTSVSSAGDVDGDGYADVIVGAPFFNDGQQNEGAAFVFLGSSSGTGDGDPTNADTTIESDQSFARLGNSVSDAGDVDGDGYGDVIVGATEWESTALEGEEGLALVFLGSNTGLVPNGSPGNAHARIQSDQADARLGSSVSGAGDVDRDGYADVIVGASDWESTALESAEGLALVYHGSSTGLLLSDLTPGDADAQIESDQGGGLLGTGVSGAGDVDGDGYGDVIVGAPGYEDTLGLSAEGLALLFLGGSSGIGDGDPTNADVTVNLDFQSARLGTSVAGAGDVNDDGCDDVIVGAPGFLGANDEGAAFVLPEPSRRLLLATGLGGLIVLSRVRARSPRYSSVQPSGG